MTIEQMMSFVLKTEKNLKNYLHSRLITAVKGVHKTQIKTRAIMAMARVLKGLLVSIIKVGH